MTNILLYALGAVKLVELNYDFAKYVASWASDPYAVSDVCRTVLSSNGTINACNYALKSSAYAISFVSVASSAFVAYDSAVRVYQDYVNEVRVAKPSPLTQAISWLKKKKA